MLVSGQQATKNTDHTADEQEADGQQQKRLVNDGCADVPNKRQSRGCDLSQGSEQSLHRRYSGFRDTLSFLLVSGQQAAKDADYTTNEQETDSQQQKRLTDNGSADIGDILKDRRCNSPQIAEQSCHSIRVINLLTNV